MASSTTPRTHGRLRLAAGIALFASTLGIIFAAYSTFDYAAHLDRQIHAVHCSFVPGAAVSDDAENPCKAALFSAYSALFRQTYWGGIPISLFALGAFAFFAGFAAYLTLAGRRAPVLAARFFAAASSGPVGASLVMFVISLTRLHAFCKICVGIYSSSALLFGAAVLFWRMRERAEDDPPSESAPTEPALPPRRGPVFLVAWFVGLGVAALLPALVYAGSLPDYRSYLSSCGKLAVLTESHGALLKMRAATPRRPVTFFEDPLCPTCKSFHARLLDEGILDKLDVTLVLFPLDSECNWMVDRSLHPGACVLAKAILCGGDNARAVLEWSFDEQEDLRAAGEKNPKALEGIVLSRWGKEIASCMALPATTTKLNQHLHYASDNHIPVSTPQMYLGDQRICDEDTDLGLRYTLGQLAPEVLQ